LYHTHPLPINITAAKDDLMDYLDGLSDEDDEDDKDLIDYGIAGGGAVCEEIDTAGGGLTRQASGGADSENDYADDFD
jgi:hypothetical protein